MRVLPYAIIIAGPMGLCTARRLKQYNIQALQPHA